MEGKSRKIELPKTPDSTNTSNYPLLRRLWMWGHWGCCDWSWWHYSCRQWREGGWRWSQRGRKQQLVPGDAEHKMSVILSSSVLCFFGLFFRVEWVIHNRVKRLKDAKGQQWKVSFLLSLLSIYPVLLHGRRHCCQVFFFPFHLYFMDVKTQDRSKQNLSDNMVCMFYLGYWYILVLFPHQHR